MSETPKRFKTVAEMQQYIDSLPEPVGMTPLEMERRIDELERELAAMTAKRDALEEAYYKDRNNNISRMEALGYDTWMAEERAKLDKFLATHGKASDTTEPEATCHTCGNELELVRPGKHQCHYCDENAKDLARRALDSE